jgi:peroxiredoxin Q/BCP
MKTYIEYDMSKNSLTEGQKAPDFCLPDQNEKNVCLKDFVGKWVVVYFYPKDNTSGCTREAQDFTFLKADFESENAVILGVSKDSVKSHIKFIEKKELGITLLSDEETTIHQKYDVWRTKKNYGKEYLGTVRSTFLIDVDGNIVKIWDNVRTKGHAEKVLETLKSMKE